MQVYSIHVQVDTTHDIFCTAGKPSQSQSTQAMLPNGNRNQWNSMYFLYYTTVIWSVLACSQATPKFGNEANLSWFLLCRVTVMACSDVSGSPVDEQTFIQVCMQWHWQLVTVASTAGHILANSPTMSTPQLKVGSWPSGNWGIDRNTAGQWSSCIIGACMSRECVCYHGNEQGVCVLPWQ